MSDAEKIASDDPAAHYDRVTRAWQLVLGDELHYGDFSHAAEDLAEATHELTNRMVSRGALVEGHRVLDVGCGVGTPAVHLGGLGCFVTGISTSRVGIEFARSRADAAGMTDHVRFELADGMNNGLSSGSFDRVWVMESSHLMDDKPRLLAECSRVLASGGRLVLCDIVLRRRLAIAEVLQKAREFDLLRRAFGRAKMATLDEYEGWATAAGLSVDVKEDLTSATRPTFAHWRENAERQKDEIWRTFGEDSWSDLVRSCAVLEAFWDEGTLGYGLVAASKAAT